MYRRDTIVACATPPGRGGVAVIRLSGDDAQAVAGRIFRGSRTATWSPWRMRHGHVVDPGSGNVVDEVLAVSMPGPRSYTGEDVVELHGHGSPIVVERVVQLAVACGARPAERGEFTRRAVLNGRMDLLQAEAVADLIDAEVRSGAEAAWRQLQGALSRELDAVRAGLVTVLADVEANVDFSDDELPEENNPARLETLGRARAAVASLLAGFPAARRRREGWRTVFTGRPNVVKSSLLNALLGSGRMIVSAEPGTTRDSVEETVDLGGYAFVLIDTAGLRVTESIAESEAIARARTAAAEADIVVAVLDGSAEIDDEQCASLTELSAEASLVVLNKADLPAGIEVDSIRRLTRARIVVTSALDGTGCEELAAALKELAGTGSEKAPVGISRARHRAALTRTAEAIEAATDLLDRAGDCELVALELRTAVEELSSISTPLDNEEVLDIIFGRFCIGK